MSDLTCPNCDPRDPPHGPEYYAVEWISVQDEDGMVEPDSGAIYRTDHSHTEEIVYAECTDCGEVLIDKRDQTVGDLL